MSKRTGIAFLLTSKVATENVYKNDDGKTLVCKAGEVNPELDVYTGPWVRSELKKWIEHSYGMNGCERNEWTLVEESDLPSGFKDTNIL